ncbi:C40 family peptidase [Mycobacterium sp. CPCC 205372]|uniref:C40 family peptidase n=1 Tax=Mycobacterium hippophais TaxID=3016340 RepID=A0ABT4PRI5_9MYCO|nr:C40 family peptidase [Mycobacterium hippophais]MCZ8379184.1 C40 family peptidase [Mycobacterium hippophais]
MPSALVAALSAPIRDVRSMVGPGWPGGAGEPMTLLAGVRDALTGVSASVGGAASDIAGVWRGAGADGATAFTASVVSATDALAAHADRLGHAARDAGTAVADARARLDAIVAGFEARAAALEPHLDDPGVAEELVAEARRSLREAIAVVEDLRARLDARAAEVTAPAGAPAPTSPAGFSAPSSPGMGSGSGGGPGSGGGLSDLASAAGPGVAALASARRPAAAPTPDARAFGDGAAVRLPDGSTAMAPNKVAADAVRHALTQLGVPYDWGGTTPGVGLDCSGLTQWAYGQAGLDIPRLAQEQDIGAAVDAGSLLPGDLAVWDGHVAMVVGDGTMIEAGDPVQLSAIRTTNAGQGFQGFWRPTA